MKSRALADLANFAQFVFIFVAMSTIFLGFLLPFSYLSHRSAVWLLPKMASSQYASLFVVAFMMVVFLMAIPAIAAFVLALLQKDVALHNRQPLVIMMILAGFACAAFSTLPDFPLLGLVSAVAAVAFLGSSIDICLGFWGPKPHDPATGTHNKNTRTEAMVQRDKWYDRTWARGVCNWCVRFLGGFMALIMLWLEARTAVSTKPMTYNENCKVVLSLISMTVLLTTFGNGLGISITKRRKDPDKALRTVAISAFVILLSVVEWAPVALFAMRLSGMGGIYELVHLKPGVHEGRVLPGFVTKPQQGSLEVCMVAQSGRAFYVSRLDKGKGKDKGKCTNKSKSARRPGACAEQIDRPSVYKIWRLPRTDVAWIKEQKPRRAPNRAA